MPLSNGNSMRAGNHDPRGSEHVILLHGLCRTRLSMAPIGRALGNAGYQVLNVNYPSRSGRIRELSENAIEPAVFQCRGNGATSVHFVTHSMGGILVRDYLNRHEIKELGRVVMIAPPNRGSELVDKLGRLWLFEAVNGPAGRELSTASDSTPLRLGPVTFPLGVIAGSRSRGWISRRFFPGLNDGKVAVERTMIPGMSDHWVVTAGHTFIMRNRRVISQTLQFLAHGAFLHAGLGGESSKTLGAATPSESIRVQTQTAVENRLQ